MFNQLFKKKEKAFHFNDMFNTYYQQGKDYFHKNDFEYAVHYLDQAYALTLSLEDLDVSEEKIENCSQMLLQLEKEETLIMKTIENIKEMAEHLTYDQRSLWNLLTLCRLEVIFNFLQEYLILLIYFTKLLLVKKNMMKVMKQIS